MYPFGAIFKKVELEDMKKLKYCSIVGVYPFHIVSEGREIVLNASLIRGTPLINVFAGKSRTLSLLTIRALSIKSCFSTTMGVLMFKMLFS
jgi:hypothetical protein